MSVCVCLCPHFSEFDGYGNLQARADARRSRRRTSKTRTRTSGAAAADRGGGGSGAARPRRRAPHRGQGHGQEQAARRLSPSAAGAAVAERPPPPPPAPWRRGRRPAPWRAVAVRRWRGGGRAAAAASTSAMAPWATAGGASWRGRRETAGVMCHDARRGRPQRRRCWPPHATAQVRKRVGAAARRIAAVATVFCLNEILTLRQICEKKLCAKYCMLRGCVPSLCSSMLI